MPRRTLRFAFMLVCVQNCCPLAQAAEGGSPDTRVASTSVSKTVLRDALIEGAHRTDAQLRIAADLPSNRLIADLIERELAPTVVRKTLSPTQLRELERRLGVTLPAGLAALLQTAGAWQAMGWSDPVDMVRAESLGNEFIQEIEASGPDWRRHSIELMDDQGHILKLRAGDVAHYLVLSRRPEFGNLILIDPDPKPAHPCCVLIETTMFDDHLHEAYPDLRNYLESEWALSKSLHE